MVPDYGKMWYGDKAVEIYSPLLIWSKNIGSLMTHTKMMLSLFTPIEVLSSSGAIDRVYMYLIPHILQ